MRCTPNFGATVNWSYCENESVIPAVVSAVVPAAILASLKLGDLSLHGAFPCEPGGRGFRAANPRYPSRIDR
jgi:hypothetical protein